jgi:hypothetical protein
VPITAPAPISAETFAKAQEQLKHNQVKARRAYQPTSQRYLLRTLVRCGQCQLPMPAARQLSVCKRLGPVKKLFPAWMWPLMG